MVRTTQPQRVVKLRELLTQDDIVLMPSCYDALSAKLIERAAHGFPDTQLLSFGEMERASKDICASLKTIPCIGDGDTGYGNALNVKRTVAAYAQAGMAGILIEDQVSPKRCGHTAGKDVVSREESFTRIQAAVDARREGNFDIVIMARTDARATHSLEEAIFRCQEFVRLGADITFLEAPRSVDEMKQYCAQVPGPKIANMVEKGLTPVLLPEQLHEIGYQIALYPVTLLSASIKAMEDTLGLLRTQTGSTSPSAEESSENATPSSALNEMLCDFAHVKDVVGFAEYYEEEARYNISRQ
uniref:Carboxyvinyl-carboxyphosphonate phosphorylmutase n=1 Tax=Globisporangium ultimum (strain ATCC 200006 / CBS 805.95 / DAOM BR144) TaxID=431595 RepID=K3XBG6_GLOUD